MVPFPCQKHKVLSTQELIFEVTPATTTNTSNTLFTNLNSLLLRNHSSTSTSTSMGYTQQDSLRSSSSTTTSLVDHEASISASASSTATNINTNTNTNTNWLQLGLLPNTTLTSYTPPRSPQPQPQPQPPLRNPGGPLLTADNLNLNLNLGLSSMCFIRKRPPSGVGLWFTLLPSLLPHSLQPCLPPLSNNFLRIKDERMKIGLVIKYVANKLGLDTHSQYDQVIEIRCRGQVVKPHLTLQHVRDHIWSPNQTHYSHSLALLPNSSTSPHLMMLHYSPSSSPST